MKGLKVFLMKGRMMNKFREWLAEISWSSVFEYLIILFIAGTLASISATLGRMEQKFEPIQELQQEIKRLDKLTECLEPAQEPDPEQKQEVEDGF